MQTFPGDCSEYKRTLLAASKTRLTEIHSWRFTIPAAKP